MTKLRRCTAASAGILIASLSMLPAGAAVAQGCDLSVSPAQIEPATPVTGTYTRMITVSNAGAQACAVSFKLMQLVHDLDGTPKYVASSRVSGSFSVDKTSATLASGAKTTLKLQGAIPAGQKSIYLGVLSTYSTAGQGQASSVAIKTQIASQYLLRGSKPWNQTGTLTDVGFMPGNTPKRREIYGIVRNAGDVHIRPRVIINVFDHGTQVGSVRLEAQRDPPPAILPGLSRRLIGVWEPRGPVSDELTLQGVATGAGPPSTKSRTVRFTTQGVALVKAATLQLSARVESKPIVTASVRNTGSEVLRASIVTIVATQDGKFERSREKFPLKPLQPAQSQTVTWSQDLPDGAYEVIATVEDDNQKLDEKHAGFEIGSVAPSPKKSRLLLFLAVGLVVLAASGSLFGFRRVKVIDPV